VDQRTDALEAVCLVWCGVKWIEYGGRHTCADGSEWADDSRTGPRPKWPYS
jgi:hypothetical protein